MHATGHASPNDDEQLLSSPPAARSRESGHRRECLARGTSLVMIDAALWKLSSPRVASSAFLQFSPAAHCVTKSMAQPPVLSEVQPEIGVCGGT